MNVTPRFAAAVGGRKELDANSVRNIDLLCETFTVGFMTELSLFEKWVEIKKDKFGFYVAKCKKGNFEVSGANKNKVTQEAIHYFMQYAQDGEYT